MHLTISRWGNSLAVRIPSEVVRKLAIEEGSEMECSLMQYGTLKLTPLSQEARKK
jgi:antitoxin MazE